MLINLEKKRLDLVFLVTFLAVIITPSLFPRVRILFFAPFLVIVIYQSPLLNCLRWASLCGLIIDILNPYTHFGICACNYSLCTFLIHRQKKHFFADRMTTLALMTFFFSLLSTIIHWALQTVLTSPIPVSGSWVLTDLILMPCIDALYAFSFLVLPPLFFRAAQRKKRLASSRAKKN